MSIQLAEYKRPYIYTYMEHVLCTAVLTGEESFQAFIKKVKPSSRHGDRFKKQPTFSYHFLHQTT